MKLFLVAALISFVGLNLAVGQEGAQRYRLAQSVYEQGRLHELPELLNDKELAKFSKADLINAYRLLTLAYIYLEEPGKADSSMLKLLNTDHFYEPNESIETAEFMGLYKTFRTKPVFNIGFRFGANATVPLLNSVYYVSNAAPGKGKYSFGVGIQGGLSYEVEILSRSKNKLYGRGKLMFAPEVFFITRTFKYTNPTQFVDDVTGASDASLTATIKQTRLDLNAIIQWKASNSKTFIPYLGFGPGASYLLSAGNTMVLTRSNSKGTVSGPDVVDNSSYYKIIPTLSGMAGFKYRFGSLYVLGEFRVQYALSNPVNPNTRSNVSSTFEYNYELPNYKPLNMLVNIGIIYPYFNPIKIKRK